MHADKISFAFDSFVASTAVNVHEPIEVYSLQLIERSV